MDIENNNEENQDQIKSKRKKTKNTSSNLDSSSKAKKQNKSKKNTTKKNQKVENQDNSKISDSLNHLFSFQQKAIDSQEEIQADNEKEYIEQYYQEYNDKYWKIENHLFLKQQYKDIPIYEKEVNGLVFIGDPHLWSKRPGRRLDNDFTQTILDKLKECVDYCNKNNYLAIFKGDLFEHPNDNDTAMLYKLVDVLKTFKFKPISLVGNHDLKEYRLTINEPLKLLEKIGLLYLIEDVGFHFKINIKNPSSKEIKQVLLGGTPYGQIIPDNILPFLIEEKPQLIYKVLTEKQLKEIEEQENANKKVGNLPIYQQSHFKQKDYDKVETFKKENGVESIIWLTHHDLAMNGAYPNSIPLKEILGVDYVVNGHIHNLKKSVLVGKTTYYNKGNIARTKIDMIDHKPAIWLFDVFNNETESTLSAIQTKKLIPHFLSCQEGKNVFKLTGKHVGKDSLTEEDIELYKQGLDLEEEKVFASLLLQANEEHNQKTDDGVFMQESLVDFFEEEKVSDELKQVLYSLAQRAIQV